MKKLLRQGVLSILFASFAVSSAQAAITAALDSPAPGPQSGNDLVSGWAFAIVDNAAVAVTVRVRIDGVTQNEVLCCNPRADVQAAFPNAPLHTGFASLIPYGELTAGSHIVGVEITAEGCEPRIIERLIQVIKPGGASFIESLDFSGADFVATPDGFRADNVEIRSAGEATTNNLTLSFSSAAQSLFVTQAEPGNPESVCQDPTRTRFLDGGAACRRFDNDQAACERSWAFRLRDGAPTSCYFGPSAGQSNSTPGCFGCGPNNLAAGLCQNTC